MNISSRVAIVLALMSAFCTRSAFGDLLVRDFNNHQVLRFTDSGALLGVFGQAHDGIGLGIPGGIAVAPWGDVYVKSMTAGLLFHFDASGNYLNATPEPTPFHRGLLFDNGGNLWLRRLGSGSNPAIDSHMLKFDADGNLAFEFPTLLAGYGPFAFDANDILYIPNDDPLPPPFGQEHAFDGVYRFRLDGTPLGAFGQATNALSGCVSPQGVVFDSQGHLLVDVVGRILKYDSDGTFLGTFAISDTGGYMVVDPLGNVYGSSGDGVQKFDLNGNFLGEIIRGGVGGVPSNFRSEAIAYIPPVPEPSVAIALLTIGWYSTRRLIIGGR